MDLDESALRLFLGALAIIAVIGLLPAMVNAFRRQHFGDGRPDGEPSLDC
jgi:hypothetical protein